jgi:hypothetical protein
VRDLAGFQLGSILSGRVHFRTPACSMIRPSHSQKGVPLNDLDTFLQLPFTATVAAICFCCMHNWPAHDSSPRAAAGLFLLPPERGTEIAGAAGCANAVDHLAYCALRIVFEIARHRTGRPARLGRRLMELARIRIWLETVKPSVSCKWPMTLGAASAQRISGPCPMLNFNEIPLLLTRMWSPV